MLGVGKLCVLSVGNVIVNILVSFHIVLNVELQILNSCFFGRFGVYLDRLVDKKLIKCC